jgi:hypothetical protein
VKETVMKDINIAIVFDESGNIDPERTRREIVCGLSEVGMAVGLTLLAMLDPVNPKTAYKQTMQIERIQFMISDLRDLVDEFKFEPRRDKP